MCEIKQTKKRGEAGGEIILVLGHANSQGYILFGRIFRKKKKTKTLGAINLRRVNEERNN